MAATYTPIASITLGADAASVTFSSIPQTYTDLILVSNVTAASANTLYCRVGTGGSVDSGTNYSFSYINGNGTSAVSGRASNSSNGFLCGAAVVGLPTGSSQAISILQINNYSNTTTNKISLSRYSFGSGDVELSTTLWRNTGAINILQIAVLAAANIKAGSTFTLYGIKAA